MNWLTILPRLPCLLRAELVQELVEHAGGRIHAESHAGEGATPIVDLPEVIEE